MRGKRKNLLPFAMAAVGLSASLPVLAQGLAVSAGDVAKADCDMLAQAEARRASLARKIDRCRAAPDASPECGDLMDDARLNAERSARIRTFLDRFNPGQSAAEELVVPSSYGEILKETNRTMQERWMHAGPGRDGGQPGSFTVHPGFESSLRQILEERDCRIVDRTPAGRLRSDGYYSGLATLAQCGAVELFVLESDKRLAPNGRQYWIIPQDQRNLDVPTGAAEGRYAVTPDGYRNDSLTWAGPLHNISVVAHYRTGDRGGGESGAFAIGILRALIARRDR